MGVGVLLPGRRCELCGALLAFSAVMTPLGNVFCASHRDLPNCQLCSAPFAGPGRYCGPCTATSVNTQEQVRAVLPSARDELRTMGLVLSPPVHVTLVDDARMHVLNPVESGRVAGTTTMSGQQVTEIYIVSGLPRMQFGSTVAHEAMHGWLAQNGYPPMEDRVEEGLCQVVAYRWLRDQPDPRAKVLRDHIDAHPDPVYGDGFRLAKQSVKRHGMNAVLVVVRATGRLP